MLRGLAKEHGSLGLLKTRRANEEWLRDVATDLRAGVVSRALDVLRDKGAVREFLTDDEARVPLVRSTAEATRGDNSALLVASRNDDVRAMNELAREAVRERIGAKRVLWDLHEHRAIDHGYATTSYRSQGQTVDSVFALASSAEAPRRLYVDVTRAREEVTIAYGKDELRDFGDLLVRARRESGKVLVRDVERNINMRIEREEERKRLRSMAFEQGREPKIDRGQGRGMGR